MMEFLVLGRVPGTNIDIDFADWLILVSLVITAVAFIKVNLRVYLKLQSQEPTFKKLLILAKSRSN